MSYPIGSGVGVVRADGTELEIGAALVNAMGDTVHAIPHDQIAVVQVLAEVATALYAQVIEARKPLACAEWLSAGGHVRAYPNVQQSAPERFVCGVVDHITAVGLALSPCDEQSPNVFLPWASIARVVDAQAHRYEEDTLHEQA